MADAWTILTNNSILGAGHDAWEHLQNQSGDSGSSDKYVSDKALLFSTEIKTIQFSSKPVVLLFDIEEAIS